MCMLHIGIIWYGQLYPDISFTMSMRKKVKCEETTIVMTVNTASSKGQQWFPLELNSSVMNTLVDKMGFDTSLYKFTNILSIEPREIRMIPQPVAAVMML